MTTLAGTEESYEALEEVPPLLAILPRYSLNKRGQKGISEITSFYAQVLNHEHGWSSALFYKPLIWRTCLLRIVYSSSLTSMKNGFLFILLLTISSCGLNSGVVMDFNFKREY